MMPIVVTRLRLRIIDGPRWPQDAKMPNDN